MIDIEKLNEGLEKLTGYDFTSAEAEARKQGDPSVEISCSKKFQAILASKVLKKDVSEILNLNLKEFTKVTMAVFLFLMGNGGMENIPALQNGTEK